MLKIVTTLIILFTNNLYAYVDLSVGYTHSTRRVEGVNPSGEVDSDFGEAVSTTKGFNVTWAWYIWEYTALELNYAETEERIVDSRQVVDTVNSITIKNSDTLVKTVTQGIGIRQSFASRKSSVIPSLSIGYARYITSGRTSYVLNTGASDFDFEADQEEEVTNSSYATVSLAFRITKLMRITLSAQTIVPGVEVDQADQNITYSGGLSWIF